VSDPTPNAGDGVITIPGAVTGVSKMAGFDIPDGLGQMLMSQLGGDLAASQRRFATASDAIMASIAATVGDNLKNEDATSSRAVSGILATPLASPTTRTP
jgi:hypothetical protein